MLKRFRTGRGFGVHSPLAFRFITGPLRDTAARYYATPSLPDAAARRWLRIAVFARPTNVLILGENRPSLNTAIKAAGLADAASRKSTLIAAVNPVKPFPLPESGVVMLIDTPPEMLRRLTAGRTSGLMTFSDRREHHILLRPDLPRQHFSISMK